MRTTGTAGSVWALGGAGAGETVLLGWAVGSTQERGTCSGCFSRGGGKGDIGEHVQGLVATGAGKF